MLRNYLKIAVRHLTKNKSYVIINTLGMGVALACCMSAYILVAFNIEFDDFFDLGKTENMAKVMAHFEHQDGRPYQNMVAPIVMAPIASEDIAGIKNYTRYVRAGVNLNYNDKAFSEGIAFADSTFFDMFEFPLKSGNHANFRNRESIYLNEDLAVKYFGEEQAVGKLMTLEFRNKKYEVEVAGVFEKIPLNSSFTMQALARIETYLDVYEIGPNQWGAWRDASTVFELTDVSQAEAVSSQLDKYLEVRNEKKADATVTSYELIPFNEPVSEDEANWSYMNVHIPIVPLLVFITLASIILLIACFNLTNTTIALTVKRLKEIGVRKVVGARRVQIVTQFLLEMVITITLAIIVGLGFSQIMVPEFMAMWGIPFGLADLSYLNLFFTLVILLFASALLAGALPAFNNSRFKPVSLLKGASKVKGTSVTTRVLLIAQFSLSIIVLIAGIIFTLNSKFQKNLNLGYDVDNVLLVSIQSPEEFRGLRNAILPNPKIEKVAVTDHHLGYGSYSNPIKIEGDTSELTTQVYEVGANYFETMGMSLTQGRSFIEDSEIDYEKAAVIDEEFVEFHKLDNPLETKIWFQGVWFDVVGVVGNHFDDLWSNDRVVEGHFYRMTKKEQYRNMVVRVSNSEDLLLAKDFIEQEWKELYPGKPFLSRTQEEVAYSNINQTNRNLTVIFLFLTVLGCLLSASGIYALANLNIERRTKEIGVRKILGASISNIIQLINREFTFILLMAMVFGGVGGYVLTDALLSEIYQTHIEVGIITVILCGLFIFFVGIGTTSSTIFRAAHANPVDTLRDE
jgi:ABC-type antimicrobial peptide transport system permease subunit